jgi:PAS domain S-box-containing protein
MARPPDPVAPGTPLEALRGLFPAHIFAVEELAELVPLCRVLDLPAGHTLIREGSESDSQVYFLLSGAMSVHINGKFILRLSRPGDIVGEMSLISEARRSATVRTDEASRFLVMHSAPALAAEEPRYYKFRYYFSRMFNLILTEKLRATSGRAKLYQDALSRTLVVEEQLMGLEGQVARNLRQIQLYSHLVDGAMDAIVVVDLGGDVLQANPAMEQSFGLGPLAIGGRPLQGLIAWPAPLTWEEIARRADAGGWQGEVLLTPPGQPRIPADCVVSLVQEGSGERLGYSVILRDLRQRKAHEDEILRQRRELERAYQAQQELERLKSHFLTLVSHELRTPITSIQAYAESLERGLVDAEEQGEFIRTIHAEAQRLGGIVDKVLAITKLESGQMYLKFQPGILADIVGARVSMLKPRAAAKGLELAYGVESDRRETLFDADLLGEVVTQLVDNAIKFTARGAIRVSYETDDVCSHVCVQDTGQGFAAEQMGAPPSKFQRGPQDVGQNYGLGLGLPLCYLILKAHSGELKIESTPGQGSSVSLTVPHEAGASSP